MTEVLFLKEFCQEILYGLGTGDEPKWFNSKHGLCFNYVSFLLWEKHRSPGRARTESYNLHGLFQELYGHSYFPFDKGSTAYMNAVAQDHLYRNPERLAFLTRFAKEV